MKNEIKIYKFLPNEGAYVRQQVFINEQGFPYDYDAKDEVSVHFVMFENGTPVAACRVFASEKRGEFILGRLAVLKPFRKQGKGAKMVGFALNYVKNHGGESLILHSQIHSVSFYEKIGFEVYGDVEDDAGAPHIWMRKFLK